MTRPLKIAILASAVAVFGGLGLATLGTAYLRPHCLPLDTMDRVRWSMKPAEAVAVLGPPSSTKRYPDGYFRISYSKPFVYCSLDVYFDPSGKMTRLFHDHLPGDAAALVDSAHRP
jgi:hypothetical protein